MAKNDGNLSRRQFINGAVPTDFHGLDKRQTYDFQFASGDNVMSSVLRPFQAIRSRLFTLAFAALISLGQPSAKCVALVDAELPNASVVDNRQTNSETEPNTSLDKELFYLYLDDENAGLFSSPRHRIIGWYNSGVPRSACDSKLLAIVDRWNDELEKLQVRSASSQELKTVLEKARFNAKKWLNDDLWENINITGVRISKEKSLLFKESEVVFGVPITLAALKKTSPWKTQRLWHIVVDVPSLEGFDFSGWNISNSKIISDDPSSCKFDRARIADSEFCGPFSYEQIRSTKNFNNSDALGEIHLSARRDTLPKDWKDDEGHNRFKVRAKHRVRDGEILEFSVKF